MTLRIAFIVLVIVFCVCSFAALVGTRHELFDAGTNNANNETIADISEGLALYYTCFSDKSYHGSGKVWKDIVNGADDRSFVFSNQPTFSNDNGFTLNTASMTGPMSMDLGMVGNSSFSIVFCASFTSFSNVADTEIIKIYSNSRNNNGLSLVILKSALRLGTLYAVNIKLTFGDFSFLANDSSTDSSVVLLSPSKVYMFSIVKDRGSISLTVFEELDNLSNSVTKNVLIDHVNAGNEDMLFSNRECCVNSTKNLNASLYNMAFYKTALDDAFMRTVVTHMQELFRRMNQVVTSLVEEARIAELNCQNVKSCKFPVDVCESCKSVGDWTQFQSLLLDGTSECRSAINTFCVSHPMNKNCVCWDPRNEGNVQCETILDIFDHTKSVPQGIRHVQEEQLNETIQIVSENENATDSEQENTSPDETSLKPSCIPDAKPTQQGLWAWIRGLFEYDPLIL